LTSTSALQPLGGPAAWNGRGSDLARTWLQPWSAACLEAFEAAINVAEQKNLAWHEADRARFPLGVIEDELKALADFLENGPGLVKLTGFPLERYTPEQHKTLLYGLGNWLGRPVFQTARGELLGEIRDEGSDVGMTRGQMLDENGKPFMSSRARAQSGALLRWHTDRTDVVGLLCAGQPAHGGTSRIASAVGVHDEMVRRRPELARVLYQDYVRSHLGEEAGGAEKTYAIPVWDVRDGKFATHYSRTYIEAAQKLPNVIPLTNEQWQALDMLAELAEEMCQEMTFELGDMQFINNHVVYHARSDFEDDPAIGKTRLLYRVWLAMTGSRPLPKSYGVLFGSTEAGAMRGGIRQPGQSISWPL
jgi:hypothetical protein